MQLGKQQNQGTYENIKEHIIKQIQKTFKNGQDIAECLRQEDMLQLDLPQRAQAQTHDEDGNAIDPEDIKFQQETINMQYQALITTHAKRLLVLIQNGPRAYAYIMQNHCSKTMRHRIENHKDFESTIINDPVELLKAIKILIHDPVTSKYPFAILTEAINRFLTTKQQEGENLLDYVKRMKQQRDVMKTTLRNDMLDTFIANTAEYHDETAQAKKDEMQAEAFEKWAAYILLKNSDQTKYGSLLNGLASQYSLTNPQYPKTMRIASDILNSHRWDKQPSHKNKDRHEKSNKDKNQEKKAESDTQMATNLYTKNSGSPFCYCCGKDNHKSNECPEKDTRPKKDWAISKAKAYIQQESSSQWAGDSNEEDDEDQDDDQSERSEGAISALTAHSRRTTNTTSSRTSRRSTRSRSRGRAFVQINLLSDKEWVEKQYKFDDTILLDSASTVDIFCNEKLVKNVHDSKNLLEMATNAGTRLTSKQATVEGYGDVWYDDKAIANIFSLHKMAKKKGYRIQYDSEVEDAFIVTRPDPDDTTKTQTRRFVATAEGLYAFQAFDNKKSEETSTCLLVDTVAKWQGGYTQREYERAKVARTLKHSVTAPNNQTLKLLLCSNIIKNCPVTPEDVDIAERIFGKDMSYLKGKSKRSKPIVNRKDIVEIPKELIEKHHNLELHIDVMFINKLPFMTGIDNCIKYRMIATLNSRKHDEFYQALDTFLRAYNAAGFVVKKLRADGEFEPMLAVIKDELDITLNLTTAGAHVPVAERNNQTIKGRVRTMYHRTPYNYLPKVMVQDMAIASTDQLNFFPVKGGVSSYFSPRMIMKQENLDYNKHCLIPFGSFVQAEYELKKTNTQHSRCKDAIYLRPVSADQGGHVCMDLHTGARFTTHKVTVLPVTEVVIKAVNALGKKQGKKGLKFENRHGIIMQDADWIAGVDGEYNQSEESNSESDSSSDSDESESDESEEEESSLSESESDDDDDDDDDDDQQEVDPQQLEEVLEEGESNPNQHPDDDEEEEKVEDEDEDEEESTEEEQRIGFRWSSRVRTDVAASRLNISSMRGQSYDPPRAEAHVQSAEPKPVSVQRAEPTPTIKVTFKDEQDARDANLEYIHNLITQVHPNPEEDLEYKAGEAMLFARIMVDIQNKVTEHGASFAQQYMLHKGLKVFGERGREGANKEMDQMHRRNCFSPISVKDMTPSERKKAQEALMFLTEKANKIVKGRMVYNGKPTREWLDREDSASPTAALESIFITAVIDAMERRDIMMCDIPNAFIQAEMPEVKPGEDRVIMKITGVLVDMLVQLDPKLYGPFVVYENGRTVIWQCAQYTAC